MERKAINTNKLYDETHAALLAGNLVTARAALDELARRRDLYYTLCAPESYQLPPNDYGQLIRDRIVAVNARVDARR